MEKPFEVSWTDEETGATKKEKQVLSLTLTSIRTPTLTLTRTRTPRW